MGENWSTLNREAFSTRDQAQRFINIMTNQHFGSEKRSLETTSKPVKFKITNEEDKFYILYQLTEKHTL